MLMEELKRVTKERDELNKKWEDAEKRAKEATDEVETLKSQAPASNETSRIVLHAVALHVAYSSVACLFVALVYSL